MYDSKDEFTTLYRRYYEQVARYVGRRVESHAVRDVVADAFLVVWRRRDDIPAEDPLPWLYAVARLTVSNHNRAAGRSTSLSSRIAAQPAPMPYGLAEEVVAQLVILEAFDRLTADDQDVLRLTAWENLDSRAAATALGCSVPAFRMRLSRARKHFKEALGRANAEHDEPSRSARDVVIRPHDKEPIR